MLEKIEKEVDKLENSKQIKEKVEEIYNLLLFDSKLEKNEKIIVIDLVKAKLNDYLYNSK